MKTTLAVESGVPLVIRYREASYASIIVIRGIKESRILAAERVIDRNVGLHIIFSTLRESCYIL